MTATHPTTSTLTDAPSIARRDPRHEGAYDERPWGSFRQYTHDEQTTVKMITVAPGQALSLQRHRHRDELWIALDDGLLADIGGQRHAPLPGQELWIPRGTVHRVANEADRPARFVEIAFGSFDEADIERLEDRYGRG